MEEQAKALFKSWFIYFEPFKDGKFVDSVLGMIPEGGKCVSFVLIFTLFSHRLQKSFLIILHFQYFFINLPMLTTSETLSADAGCVPCGRTPKRKPAEGGEELLKRNDLTVGNHLWIRRLLDALFLTLRNLVNFTYCQRAWQW